MHLVFSRGPGFVGGAIRWHSRADWNHVAIWDEENLTCYEAREFRGVIRTEAWWPGPGPDVRVCAVDPRLCDAERQAIRDWCEARVGRKYDYLGVLKFVSRRRVRAERAERRWFCSEFAAEAFRAGGRELLRCPGWLVTPGGLYQSPMLVDTNTIRCATLSAVA